MEFGAREKDMNALNWKPQRINLRREYYWVTYSWFDSGYDPLDDQK